MSADKQQSCGCSCGSLEDLVVQPRSAVGRVLVLPSRAVAWLLVALVRAYQLFISPALGPRCRFSPSCSAYAIGALRRHGVIKGTAKAAWRLLRCHPWSKGGYDPP